MKAFGKKRLFALILTIVLLVVSSALPAYARQDNHASEEAEAVAATESFAYSIYLSYLQSFHGIALPISTEAEAETGATIRIIRYASNRSGVPLDADTLGEIYPSTIDYEEIMDRGLYVTEAYVGENGSRYFAPGEESLIATPTFFRFEPTKVGYYLVSQEIQIVNQNGDVNTYNTDPDPDLNQVLYGFPYMIGDADEHLDVYIGYHKSEFAAWEVTVEYYQDDLTNKVGEQTIFTSGDAPVQTTDIHLNLYRPAGYYAGRIVEPDLQDFPIAPPITVKVLYEPEPEPEDVVLDVEILHQYYTNKTLDGTTTETQQINANTSEIPSRYQEPHYSGNNYDLSNIEVIRISKTAENADEDADEHADGETAGPQGDGQASGASIGLNMNQEDMQDTADAAEIESIFHQDTEEEDNASAEISIFAPDEESEAVEDEEEPLILNSIALVEGTNNEVENTDEDDEDSSGTQSGDDNSPSQEVRETFELELGQEYLFEEDYHYEIRLTYTRTVDDGGGDNGGGDNGGGDNGGGSSGGSGGGNSSGGSSTPDTYPSYTTEIQDEDTPLADTPALPAEDLPKTGLAKDLTLQGILLALSAAAMVVYRRKD